VNCFGPLDLDLTDHREEESSSPRGLGVPAISGEVAARRRAPASFQRVLDGGDATTMIRETRRARKLGRRRRLLAE
jgi:hypothetical protein